MGRFFSSLFASLSSAGRAVIAFLLPVLRRRAGELLAQALPLAEGIVLSLVTSPMAGADKRNVAADDLKQALLDSGKATAAELTQSVLNLAIEMAVSRLKATL